MEQYVSVVTWLKKHSKQLTTFATAAAVLVAIVLIAWLLMSRRSSNAAESLAEAYRYHDALVANPIPPTTTGYAFTTEDEKHRKAYEAFEKAAREYPSYHGDLARYLGATHQLHFEPEKAEATLVEIAGKESEVGALARLALAERYEATGKLDEALAEYRKLKSNPFNVPLAMIDINSARVYEALGKTKEAIDLYYSVASNKDWRTTSLGSTAINRLTILAPEKVEQLPPPENTNPLAGLSNLGGLQPQ